MADIIIGVLAIIGLIVGIIIGVKAKKARVLALLVSLTIWWAFGPALTVITDLLTITNVQVFPWIIALVANFGLGAAIILAVRALGELAPK